MSDESRELGLYIHKSGLIVDVIHFGRNADDCKQEIVIFKTTTPTDLDAGTIWVKPVTSFFDKGRFRKYETPTNTSI